MCGMGRMELWVAIEELPAGRGICAGLMGEPASALQTGGPAARKPPSGRVSGQASWARPAWDCQARFPSLASLRIPEHHFDLTGLQRLS